jgi:hypothetical protein
MRNSCVLGLVGIFLFLSGCVSYSANTANNDEQIDIYLSTLDDKHFVWCELDLAQCREDFEKWKLTPRGRTLIREYEKEATGQTYHTHHVPNVFRTGFVDESGSAKEVGEQKARQQVLEQNSDSFIRARSSINKKTDSGLHVIPLSYRVYGPEPAR